MYLVGIDGGSCAAGMETTPLCTDQQSMNKSSRLQMKPLWEGSYATDMSGSEVAGLVLGALPLLIVSLDHYSDGVKDTFAIDPKAHY
jgi:hypothetical protein